MEVLKLNETRKQEIIGNLQSIYDNFQPSEDEPDLTMFSLISKYNSQYENTELIGGMWVRENCPEPMKSLS